MAILLPTPILYGDTSDDLADHDHGGAQSLTGSATVIGDANALLDHAAGGDDTIDVFSITGDVVAIGDAITMTDHATGGDDHLIADANVFAATVVGDAVTLTGHAHGGNDTMTAIGRSSVTLYGDAQIIEDHAVGGNDTVIVGASRFGLFGFGDAQTITDHGRGGDDVVSGQGFGTLPQQLYGDAFTLSGFAIGGNDTVIGANGGGSQIYGDGHELLDHARGGDDVLVSGAANDLMWGDAPVVAPTAQTGADTFLFDRASQPSLGNDTIEDFEPGKDHISLQNYSGVATFGDLTSHIADTTAGSLITFDAQNTILVVNDHNLTASDFAFS
ncbi:MAG TPA: hypothetical protein VL966_11945 [Alphaproteobacteria bacterium]|jgi:hypothetical protein|nr:hypothetical protein [Alphaproteobacteria bacterium]